MRELSHPRWTTWISLLLCLVSLTLLAWRLGDTVGRAPEASQGEQGSAQQVTSTVTPTLAGSTATVTLTLGATSTVTRTPGPATATPRAHLYMPLIVDRGYRPAGGGGRLVWADNRGTDRKWNIWIQDADGARQINLGTEWEASDEIDPVISQDGQTIVFATNRHGDLTRLDNRHFEIYRMTVSGTNLIRLTESTGFTSVNPAISPDGRRVVFTSDAGAFNSLDIYSIPLNTPGNAALGVSSWQRLTWPDAAPTLRPSPTVPSPTPSPTTTPRTDPTITPTATLSVYDNFFRQSSSRQPSWSPDGARVAFVTNRRAGNEGCGQEEIYIMDATGYNQRRLTCSHGQNLWPRWSPDGQQIVYVSNRDGNWELYSIRPDGANERRLTRTQWAESQPTWVRNTSDIAYVGVCLNATTVTYQYGICLLRGVIGAEGRLLVPAVLGGDIYSPSWSQAASQ